MLHLPKNFSPFQLAFAKLLWENPFRILPTVVSVGEQTLFSFLTPALLSCMLAFVAGIMVFISLDEILPLAHRYGKEHLVLIGLGAGMLVMAISLFLLH